MSWARSLRPHPDLAVAPLPLTGEGRSIDLRWKRALLSSELLLNSLHLVAEKVRGHRAIQDAPVVLALADGVRFATQGLGRSLGTLHEHSAKLVPHCFDLCEGDLPAVVAVVVFHDDTTERSEHRHKGSAIKRRLSGC